MALETALTGVSPNCNAISFYTLTDSNNYTVSIYLVEGSEETEIYRQVDLGDGTQSVVVDSLITDLNEIYGVDPDLDAIIESITNFNGAFKVEVKEYDLIDSVSTLIDSDYMYYLGTCAIDCCMANLLSTVINCNCDGGDCHDVIRKIEKILILIRCAVVDAANKDVASALEKYNKAAELCDSTCDCNC